MELHRDPSPYPPPSRRRRPPGLVLHCPWRLAQSQPGQQCIREFVDSGTLGHSVRWPSSSRRSVTGLHLNAELGRDKDFDSFSWKGLEQPWWVGAEPGVKDVQTASLSCLRGDHGSVVQVVYSLVMCLRPRPPASGILAGLPCWTLGPWLTGGCLTRLWADTGRH